MKKLLFLFLILFGVNFVLSAGLLGSDPFIAINSSSGRIGLGVSNPSYDLDVLGHIRASGQLISSVGVGTSPFEVSSTTKVANLNSDLLDGYDSSDFLVNRGVIGDTDVAFGSTSGWPNNPLAGSYRTDYDGSSGLVFMSNDVGGSTSSIGLEFKYNGYAYFHSNTDSNRGTLTKCGHRLMMVPVQDLMQTD